MSHFLKFVPDFRSAQEDTGCFPSLTFKERLLGFAVCFGLSVFLYILAWYRMLAILIGGASRFALTYTLGNFLSILATGFLIGFKRQLTSVFDSKRKVAALVYVGSMTLTLVSAVVFQFTLLTLVFIMIQVSSFVWYAASYIPWGRECLASCCWKSYRPSFGV